MALTLNCAKMPRYRVVTFIKWQLEGRKTKREKGHQFHYGRQELRELLDFIYGQEPQSDEEKIPRGPIP